MSRIAIMPGVGIVMSVCNTEKIIQRCVINWTSQKENKVQDTEVESQDH